MKTQDFTVEMAIEIQKEHLAKWKRLLKSRVYLDLEKWATENNHLAVTGYEIKRGTDLDNFIHNYGVYTPCNKVFINYL